VEKMCSFSPITLSGDVSELFDSPCFRCPRPSAYLLSHGVAWYSTREGIVAHVIRVMGIHQNVILAPLLLPVVAVRGACLDDTYVNLFCNCVSYFFT